jgi:hypothetical protein
MNDILRNPGSHAHFVQLYGASGELAEAVAEYVNAGHERGEAAVVIARPEHRAALGAKLRSSERLVMLDAERTLERFMANGMPQWQPFHETIGGLIAQLRLSHPAVRAYGEMVDVLWQRGEREAAIRLEEYWNELGRLQTFSLFCAYRMDPCDPAQYDGALQSVCKVHSHMIPGSDPERFDEAVQAASRKVLDPALCNMLGTFTPGGQATLFWLQQNMPRAAEKVFSELRAGAAPAG